VRMRGHVPPVGGGSVQAHHSNSHNTWRQQQQQYRGAIREAVLSESQA
jgi:hypothetical protein